MCIKIHFILVTAVILTFGFMMQPNALAKQNREMPHQPTTYPNMASKSVLVIDVSGNKIIYANNPDRIVPIASLTKLMTAMVVLDARQPLAQSIPVKINQTKELQGVYSRVRVGSEISRKEMLLLTLMSSENRAAASLAHNYPGGYNAFIKAMNAKAKALGMKKTRFVEPTGLSEHNVSTARDLSKLLMATKRYPLLSQLSVTKEKTVIFNNPKHSLAFRNTNQLIHNDEWNIKLTKTGFTRKAGRCLTMRTIIGNREIAIITLDAYGKYTHFADAKRLRNWMESTENFPMINARTANKNVISRTAVKK